MSLRGLDSEYQIDFENKLPQGISRKKECVKLHENSKGSRYNSETIYRRFLTLSFKDYGRNIPARQFVYL